MCAASCTAARAASSQCIVCVVVRKVWRKRLASLDRKRRKGERRWAVESGVINEEQVPHLVITPSNPVRKLHHVAGHLGC